MKKVLGKKEYDTDSARLVKQYICGYFGDPAGYEERLYETNDGFYFIYVCGGSDSRYPEENIIRIAKSKVPQWLEDHK